MPKLKNITVRGFRSIKEMTLELRPLNVLIGANGAGKSNLVAFFKLVNELMGGRLQQHIGATGRATANLHFGPRVTPQLEAEMAFEVENGTDTYKMRLFHAAGDSMIFAEETLSFHQTGYPSPKVVSLGVGHQETRIGEEAEKDEPAAKMLRYLLNRCRVYHFHDTSPTFESPAVLLRWRQPLAHARCSESGGFTVCTQVLQRNGLSPDCGDHSAGGTVL